ncbi:hypothetical protein M1E11_18740 [Bacillus sp. JZ8]
MTKATKITKTTIQIHGYDKNTMEETIYKAQVGSIEDMLALTYQFENMIKYKKITDKTWYYAKTMIKRLFKKELSKIPNIEYVATNDFKETCEENRQDKQEIILKSKKEQVEWDQPERFNSRLNMGGIE